MHVADFGIASAAGLDSLTQTGTVLGTASYLSPEQAKGERTTQRATATRSAVVAFELLTGRRPFEGDSVAAEAAAHVPATMPSVCDVNPALPCELDPVFARALAKNPDATATASCAEFVAALRDALETPPARRGSSRRRRGATAAASPAHRPRLLVPRRWRLLLVAGIAAGPPSPTRRAHSATKPPPPQQRDVSVKTVTQQGTTVVTTAPRDGAAADDRSRKHDRAAVGRAAYALNNAGVTS